MSCCVCYTVLTHCVPLPAVVSTHGEGVADATPPIKVLFLGDESMTDRDDAQTNERGFLAPS